MLIRDEAAPFFPGFKSLSVDCLGTSIHAVIGGTVPRFSSFTAPHNRTLCGAKLPLVSPGGSPLLPRTCEGTVCLQNRLEE